MNGKCFGTYEDFFDTPEIEVLDSKHHLVTVYRWHFEDNDPMITEDDQHSSLDLFQLPLSGIEPHPYIERNLDTL